MAETKIKKEYVFLRDSSLEHYEAENFDVACVDDRFTAVREAFNEQAGLEHVDVKTPAGGAKVFSSPFEDTDREHYLSELAISVRLHHVKKVRLFAHHDCGAYGGFSAFDKDENKEFEFHLEEQRKAADVIRKRFPELEVEAYFIDDKGIARTY